MPTPPHYSPLLFFSPCLEECIPHLVICRVTMWTSAWIRLCLLWVEMSKLILCFWVVLAYTYLIATLLCFLSILVHDGWLDLDSLLLMGTLEEICWVFLLQRELTCQDLCWLLAFHANTLTLFTALILLSILVHDGGLELGSLLFDGNSEGNLWSVPSATWVDRPSFKLNSSNSCQHPHIIHRSYSSLHVWWSAFLTWWFVEWRCGQVPWIRLCLWWVEMSKLILCFWVVLAYTYLIATLLCFLSILVHDGWLDLDSLLLMGTLEEICGMFLLQRELTCQVLCWLLAFHANTPTLFTALILISMSGGVHSSLGDL